MQPERFIQASAVNLYPTKLLSPFTFVLIIIMIIFLFQVKQFSRMVNFN